MKGKLLRLGLLSSLVVASVGCDPGVHYRPRDWTQVDAVHWRTDVGGVSLTMRPIGGLIGETWLDPDIEIQNLTSVAVTMVSATPIPPSKVPATATYMIKLEMELRLFMIPSTLRTGHNRRVGPQFRTDHKIWGAYL